MNKLERLLEASKQLTDEFIGELFFSNEEIQELIIYLNTEKQLFIQGVDSKGDLLPLYHPVFGKNPGKPFNLKETGEFYESHKVIVTRDGNARIESDPIKEDNDLREIASPFITGLTDESKEELQEEKEILGKEIWNKINIQ